MGDKRPATVEREWKLALVHMENSGSMAASPNRWQRLKTLAERAGHLNILFGVLATLGFGAATLCYQLGATVAGFGSDLKLMDARIANIEKTMATKADLEALRGDVSKELVGVKAEIAKVSRGLRYVATQVNARQSVNLDLLGRTGLVPAIPWGGREVAHPAPTAQCASQGSLVVCSSASLTPILASVPGSVINSGDGELTVRGEGETAIYRALKATAKTGQQVRMGDLVGYAERGAAFSLEYRRADRVIDPPASLAATEPKPPMHRAPRPSGLDDDGISAAPIAIDAKQSALD